MTSGDLLKKLFQSYKKRDGEAFNAVALQIIAEEKRKNHNILAEELQRIMKNGASAYKDEPFKSDVFGTLPKDKDNGSILVEVKHPKRLFSDLVLDKNLQDKLRQIVKEFTSSHILRSYGLKPKRKILFAGPPGCGKTVTAEAVAGEIGLPILYTRFDAVISSYLGETASNLRKVFDYASEGQWVVFFDEFDAIGKSRADESEHGELKRVVNTFLQLLDNFHSDGLVIAATNHQSLLDAAIWRRFDEIIFFGKPSEDLIEKLITLNLRSFSHKGLDMEAIKSSMIGWSHADIERAIVDAMKVSVIRGQALDNEIMNKAISNQKNRMDVIEST